MKLLIVKLSSLGDIVQAMEAVKKVPHAEVHWVVEKQFSPLVEDIASKVHLADTKKWRKNLFKYFPEIQAFIRRLRSEKYDLVVDLQGNFKSSLILPFVNAKRKIGFDKKAVPESINLLFTNERYLPEPKGSIRQDYLSLLEQALGFKASFEVKSASLQIKKVLVCPFSAWKNKQLPQDILLNYLKTFDAEFSILWGNEQEKAAAKELASLCPRSRLLPKLSLTELKSIILEHDLVIAMDSFPLHYAAYLGVPTFSFFGPSSGAKYAPIGPNSHYVQGSCPYGQSFTKRCPQLRRCPTGACMNITTARESNAT